MNFDFQSATLTVLWGEGAKTAAYIYKGLYDTGTDYVAGDQAFYGTKVYLCLDANGPGSALKTPGETLWWTACTAYDVAVDYVLGNVVYYNSTYWSCLIANGPSSACVEPTECASWTATTYAVNDAKMVYHTCKRVAVRVFTWAEIVLLTTGEFTEDQLLDLVFLQGGYHLNFLAKNLYDALTAIGQEPLPTP